MPHLADFETAEINDRNRGTALTTNALIAPHHHNTDLLGNKSGYCLHFSLFPPPFLFYDFHFPCRDHGNQYIQIMQLQHQKRLVCTSYATFPKFSVLIK